MTKTLELERRELLIPSSGMRALVKPESFNAQARTFEVVWSAGAIVRRYDWWNDQAFEEELDMSAEACDLSRLKNAAPFCLDHRSWSVGGVAGVFEEAWLSDGKGYGRIRASGRPEFAGILDDVKAGILRHISVGYDVLEFQDVTLPTAKIRRLRAVRWQPFEASLVAVGADDEAIVRTRTATAEKHPCTVFLLPRSFAMDPIQTPNGSTPETRTASASGSPQAPAQPAARAADPAPAAAPAATAVLEAPSTRAADTTAGAQAERSRILEVQRIGKRLKAPEAEIQKLVDSGATLDQAREKLIGVAAAADDQTATRSSVNVGSEPRQGMRASMENYLLHRIDPKANKLEEHGRQFVGFSMVDMARQVLEANGLSTRGLTRMELATRALQSTSDFPELLANVATKTLRNGYMIYPSQWASFCRVVPAADFKQISSISIGDSPKLLEVGEHAEFKRGKLVESAEKYSLKTYGRIVSLTRQAIVNDDTDAFMRIPQMLGAGAAAVVADLVFGVLTANANMSDGNPLFHATHANLGVKTLTIDGLTEMRTAMRKQTGPNAQKLNVQPAYVIVPSALETVALQLLVKEIVPTQFGNANPFKGMMMPIVEPRLDDASAIVWYGAADPGMMDGIQVSFLEGQDNGPMIETRAGFDVDGVEIKVRMDVAAKAVESKGLWKSAGTTP